MLMLPPICAHVAPGLGVPMLSLRSVPMLPPDLAHGELSLNQDVARNTLSVFLRVEVRVRVGVGVGVGVTIRFLCSCEWK